MADTSEDPWTLAQKIEKGLPYRAFTDLRRSLGLSQDAIAHVIRVPPRTLARRQQAKRFQPDESERLIRLERVFDGAVRLFEENIEKAREWMSRTNRALDGHTPLEACRTEIGAREVESLIGRLEHGVVN